MSDSLVSVIVTFYNQAKWVRSALDSVAAQTETDIQLIVTDDGSTDGTEAEIANWCSANWPSATVVRAPENVGVPAILNLAAPHVRGLLMMVHNGDDVLPPDRVRAQAEALLAAPDEVGVVYSDLIFTDIDGVPTGTRRPDPDGPAYEGDVFHHFIRESFMPGVGGLMVRSALLDVIGPWAEDLLADDFDFTLRLAKVTEFRYVPVDALFYRVHDGSLSRRSAELAEGRAVALLRQRGHDREVDGLIDRRVVQLASHLHEYDFDRKRTRRLLWASLRRTRQKKCLRQLISNLVRSTPLAKVGASQAGVDRGRSRRPDRLKARIETLSGSITSGLLVIAVLAVVSGALQALILIMIAGVATSFGALGGAGTFAPGPLSGLADSTPAMLVAAFVVVVIYALNQLLEAYASARLLARVTYRTRRSILSAYSQADWAAKEPLEGTALVQLATVNASKSSAIVTDLSGLFSSGFNFIVLLATAVVVEPFAAVVVASGVAVVMIVTLPLVEASRRQQVHLAKLSRQYVAEVQQHSALCREVEVFGVQRESIDVIDDVNKQHTKRIFRSSLLIKLNTSVYKVSGFLLVLGMIAGVVAAGADDLARLSAVALILLRSISYGQGAQRSWQQLAESSAWLDQLERDLQPLLDSVNHREVQLPGVARTGPIEIELAHVNFGYTPSSRVLNDVSCHIRPGALVGLVGASGAGKSTLAEILLGLRSPDSGMVLIDGVDRREVDPSPSSLSVAYVRQEPVLIRGSIIDNVRFYRPWVSDTDAREALAAANILEEAESWPDGLDTDPGTLGARISGGQKQRIAIARALAGRPRLLVLDEPTSALDATSEAAVNQALRGLSREMTVVVIAHRASTLDGCTTVLSMNDGVLTVGSPTTRRADSVTLAL